MSVGHPILDTLSALDEAHPVREPQGMEPGYTMHLVRQNIRDLRRMVGFEDARAFVAGVLLDEANPPRTINHDPREHL